MNIQLNPEQTYSLPTAIENKNALFNNKYFNPEEKKLGFTFYLKDFENVTLSFCDNAWFRINFSSNLFFSNEIIGHNSDLSAELTECLNACNQKFTRPDGTNLPGKGLCKAACWWEIAVRTRRPPLMLLNRP